MSQVKTDPTKENTFQNDIIDQLIANGWILGSPKKYDRKRALYTPDLLAYIKETQSAQWQKFCKLYPNDAEDKLCQRVANQLNKADPNAANQEIRTYGTLGVLRQGIRDRGCRFNLCQFKPQHNLNPDTLANYKKNRCTVVPELVYSPYATEEHLKKTGKQAKAWRIDLVLFVNGIPVSTLELKSEFKQTVQNAIKQYKNTRPPKDPITKNPEPLLTFKRGALVHFAVSQYEVYMTTHLQGKDTFFLPFNKGSKDGGAGNPVPKDINQYPTDYLWNEVLLPDNLLNILARFVHLQIQDKENALGKKYKKETLIFPRYHQWDVVKKLIGASKTEGPGQKYLIQHSAGSGKSNSIAWTAHQLSSLYTDKGTKQFHSVIVVTDRTVLDSQLQETISQFEQVDGVVGCINHDQGDGSKSEKLAKALESAQPIIIVTIQTFPFVMEAIENSVSLKTRNYAIIADEAHSSQTGATARKLKEVLNTESEEEDAHLSSEDKLTQLITARSQSKNLSYYAFTATPKTKTLELFGRVPNPNEEPSKDNLPKAFHVYSMRQAIEEGFILDVLKNYTNYKIAYQLAMKVKGIDEKVASKKAKVKLNQWVRLNGYNIAQKVKVIIEHFNGSIKHLLGGQAKAMLVTGSRKEAVRYKIEFDKYIAHKGYTKLAAMIAFSSEVTFSKDDPDVEGLLDKKFTESNMNPGLKGRDMRKAFDTNDYQVMIVANKFQTGFDQPKLCAMYVDKKLGGVDCVQTLSRLNRTYPGKSQTGVYILDFVNDPAEIKEAFMPYYQTAELADVSDPNKVFDLSDKLRESKIFTTSEVNTFWDVFRIESKSAAAVANVCKPAVQRWNNQYKEATAELVVKKDMAKRAKKSDDPVLMANADKELKEVTTIIDKLGLFKKDLITYVRFYEFMSQILDYADPYLEKLCLYARNLAPMLRESMIHEDEIDLHNVELSHYRLSVVSKQNLGLATADCPTELEPGEGLGSGKGKDIKEEFISQIITRLNEVFITDELTDKDMINYAFAIRDKISEDIAVMLQIKNNTPEQALLGDFPKAMESAVMDSSEAHQNQMHQLLSDTTKAAGFARVVFSMLQGAG